jgi:hypothetical protein
MISPKLQIPKTAQYGLTLFAPLGKCRCRTARIFPMSAAIHYIQTANEELTKLQSEMLRLEQRIQTLQRTLREATEAVAVQEQRPAPSRPQTPMTHCRLAGEPLKTSAEISARVQQILRLETQNPASSGRARFGNPGTSQVSLELRPLPRVHESSSRKRRSWSERLKCNRLSAK